MNTHRAAPSISRSPLVLLTTWAVLTACGGGGGSGGGGAVYLLAGAFGAQYYSTDLLAWTPVDGIAGVYNSRGVAFGDGIYVWTGDCGVGCFASAAAATTVADPNYAQTEFGASTEVHEVAFGHDVFVAVGRRSDDAMSWVSPDGVNWMPNPIAGYRIARQIVFAEDVFLTEALLPGAPAQDDLLLSADAVTWAPITLIGCRDICDVSHGDGNFIAVGFCDNDEPCAWFSADGMVWSGPVDLGDPFGITLCSLSGAAWGNGVWVVVGAVAGVGQAWVSNDGGGSWTTRMLTSPLNDVVFVDGRFLAVGDNGVVLAATDGATWSNMGPGGTGVRLHTIAIGR